MGNGKGSEETGGGIPRSLAPFFQECSLDELDIERHWETIVERTLRYGNRQEWRWLFQLYGRERIARWVREMGWWRLPPRHLNFWCLVLDIEDYRRLAKLRSRIWPH